VAPAAVTQLEAPICILSVQPGAVPHWVLLHIVAPNVTIDEGMQTPGTVWPAWYPNSAGKHCATAAVPVPVLVEAPPDEVVPPIVVEAPPDEVVPPIVVEAPPDELLPPLADAPPNVVESPPADAPPTEELPPVVVVPPDAVDAPPLATPPLVLPPVAALPPLAVVPPDASVDAPPRLLEPPLAVMPPLAVVPPEDVCAPPRPDPPEARVDVAEVPPFAGPPARANVPPLAVLPPFEALPPIDTAVAPPSSGETSLLPLEQPATSRIETSPVDKHRLRIILATLVHRKERFGFGLPLNYQVVKPRFYGIFHGHSKVEKGLLCCGSWQPAKPVETKPTNLSR